MQKLVVLTCLVMLCLPPAMAPAAGEVRKISDNLVEVTVSGQGTSKEEALRDAQRKAVEAGAGTFIYSRSETKDFMLVKDTVLARAAHSPVMSSHSTTASSGCTRITLSR